MDRNGAEPSSTNFISRAETVLNLTGPDVSSKAAAACPAREYRARRKRGGHCLRVEHAGADVNDFHGQLCCRKPALRWYLGFIPIFGIPSERATSLSEGRFQIKPNITGQTGWGGTELKVPQPRGKPRLRLEAPLRGAGLSGLRSHDGSPSRLLGLSTTVSAQRRES